MPIRRRAPRPAHRRRPLPAAAPDASTAVGDPARGRRRRRPRDGPVRALRRADTVGRVRRAPADVRGGGSGAILALARRVADEDASAASASTAADVDAAEAMRAEDERVAHDVERSQLLQREQDDATGFTRGDSAQLCQLCDEKKQLCPGQLKPHPIFDFCVCKRHASGLKNPWRQEYDSWYEREPDDDVPGDLGEGGYCDSYCSACGDSNEDGVVHCDEKCGHVTCGEAGTRCRLEFCEKCLASVFMSDHRDRHNDLRGRWRCPLCRVVPRNADAGVEEWAHHRNGCPAEVRSDETLGETAPLLREGWKAKLKLRVYELVNDVDEGGEDGDENAGVSAPADDDAATNADLPDPGTSTKLGNTKFMVYNPVDGETLASAAKRMGIPHEKWKQLEREHGRKDTKLRTGTALIISDSLISNFAAMTTNRPSSRKRSRPAVGARMKPAIAMTCGDYYDDEDSESDDDVDFAGVGGRRRNARGSGRSAASRSSRDAAVTSVARWDSSPGKNPCEGCAGNAETSHGPHTIWEGVEFAFDLDERARHEKIVVDAIGVGKLVPLNAYPCFARMLRKRLFALTWSGHGALASHRRVEKTMEELLGVTQLGSGPTSWWPKNLGKPKDYLMCVNAREVDGKMLGEINELIAKNADLAKVYVSTGKHRKTAASFCRVSGLVPSRLRSDRLENPPEALLVEDLFGFPAHHLSVLATSGKKKTAMGECIQVNVLEYLFEPLVKLYDDDAHWRMRGCESPKKSGGWSIWVLFNGVGAFEVAFHNVARRANQKVRVMLGSEILKDLNQVVEAWATGPEVKAKKVRAEEIFSKPPPARASSQSGPSLLQMGSVTDEKYDRKHLVSPQGQVPQGNWVAGVEMKRSAGERTTSSTRSTGRRSPR